MDTLSNRKQSRAAKASNGGEQIPTVTTKQRKGTTHETVFVTPGDFHRLLKHSTELDVNVASDDIERKRAATINASIHAPEKHDKQTRTAKSDAEIAANSKLAEETQKQQGQGQSGNGGGNTANAGWGTGGGAVNGNPNGFRPPVGSTESGLPAKKK